MTLSNEGNEELDRWLGWYVKKGHTVRFSYSFLSKGSGLTIHFLDQEIRFTPGE